MLQKGHTEAHRTSFGHQFTEEDAVVQYYTVYGVAVQQVKDLPVGDLDPLKRKLVLVPKRLPTDRFPDDAELHIAGLLCEGDTVLGLAVVDGDHFVVNTSWDPDPEPPGKWRKRDVGRWPARWVPNTRKPVWEHLDADPFAPE